MAIRRTDAPRERTAEERLRAREERERKRQGIDAQPVLALPPEPIAAPPEPAAAPRRAHVPRPHVPRPHLPHPHLPHPHLPHPHLSRPHVSRPHMPRPRSSRARAGATLALLVVIAALGAGVVAIVGRGKTAPVKAPAIVRVLVPEGLTRLEIARLAHADGLKGSYLKATLASSARFPASRYGAPKRSRNLEGFLFPATYELYAGASVEKLVSAQLQAFQENFGADEIRRARALGVTPYELLIVASMVEREASLARERPLVAAVIYNRLRQNMPLGIDATIRYVLHDFSHPLTESELHSSSPYNTRLHTGLPPTPISNPGSASIHAAAHPSHVSYLYYVARADGCPGQTFSSSYSKFQSDAAAYQQALSRNHGRVPACHKG